MASTISALKRHRAKRLASMGTKAYILHKRGKDAEMYNIICDEFMDLGGVYVKFLQGVLLRSPIMKKYHNADKLRVFENLESEPLDLRSVLQAELTPIQLQQISMIQPQPFAAGSFGQVYYGIHANGKPIVIKVLRPLVRDTLSFDLKLLTRFAKSFYLKTYKHMQNNAKQALKDFREATLRETDYIEEARFAAEMYEAYKDDQQFVIPQTYLDLCTKNIIVQEYIDGLSVAYLLKLKEQGVDPAAYVRETLGSDLDAQLITLGFESSYGVFKLPRVQGDPHPGNIRLLTGNRVGMIDFGISTKTPDNKAALYGLLQHYDQLYTGDDDIAGIFEQFIKFFVSDLYRALKRISRQIGGQTGEDLTRHIGVIAEKTFQATVGKVDLRPMIEDGSILKVVNRVANKQNRFGFVMKLEASDVLRTSITYMTLVESLGRHAHVFPTVFSRTVQQIATNYPELLHDSEEQMSMSEALETVTNWLERVANRDPALFRELVAKIKINPTKLETQEA